MKTEYQFGQVEASLASLHSVLEVEKCRVKTQRRIWRSNIYPNLGYSALCYFNDVFSISMRIAKSRVLSSPVKV
jgi:hypothetical protein